MITKNKEVILVCKKVKFYSPNDEAAFFEWLHKIKCIKELSRARDILYLHITGRNIPNYDLRSLIGLFYRYKIHMKQLQVFLNKNNKKWFYEGTKGFWYKRVFG